MTMRKQHTPPPMLRVKVLQISGISLITLSILNLLFLPTISYLVDFLFFGTGILMFYVSYRLWRSTKARYARQRQITRIKAAA